MKEKEGQEKNCNILVTIASARREERTRMKEENYGGNKSSGRRKRGKIATLYTDP